jgi:putative membrane protein
MADQLSSNKPMLDRSTELAFARTRAAYERTMMAWIRTSTSLITFGFSIYKFFQIETPALAAERKRLIGPREFAFMLVGIGLVSLVLATLEYRQNIRTLGAEYADMRRSLAVLVASLVSLLGLVALLVIYLRQ